MSYREITHIALHVASVREAEEFYRGLFGLEVAQEELDRPRTEGPARGCRVLAQRGDLAVLADRWGRGTG